MRNYEWPHYIFSSNLRECDKRYGAKLRFFDQYTNLLCSSEVVQHQ